MSIQRSLGNYVVAKDGRRTAVILPIAHYEALLQDLHDLGVVAERRREKAVPLSELRRRLKRHGRI